MSLADVSIGTQVQVELINANKPLKQRLMSLGIIKDSVVMPSVENMGRQNIKVSIGHTSIALRISEAKQIQVKLCK